LGESAALYLVLVTGVFVPEERQPEMPQGVFNKRVLDAHRWCCTEAERRIARPGGAMGLTRELLPYGVLGSSCLGTNFVKHY
jgi:hypothetical protein